MPEAYIAPLLQIGGTALVLAMAWGGLRAAVANIAKAVETLTHTVEKIDDKVNAGALEAAALSAAVDEHGRQLERLEAPLFQRRQ